MTTILLKGGLRDGEQADVSILTSTALMPGRYEDAVRRWQENHYVYAFPIEIYKLAERGQPPVYVYSHTEPATLSSPSGATPYASQGEISLEEYDDALAQRDDYRDWLYRLTRVTGELLDVLNAETTSEDAPEAPWGRERRAVREEMPHDR